MKSMSDPPDVALRSDLNSPPRRRRPSRAPLYTTNADFYLFRPRTAHHPLLREAYELWRDSWRETLCQLEGITRINSDEFDRQDEVAVLVVGQRCAAVAGLRWIDLSLPMGREDSCFLAWPESAMAQIEDRLVGLVSNMVLARERRGSRIGFQSNQHPHDTPLSQATLSLAIRRFLDSPAECVVGTARNDRSTNRLACNAGGRKVGQTAVHGIDSDLIVVERAINHTTLLGPVVDELWNRRRCCG